MSSDVFHDLARAHASEFRPEFIERLDERQFRTLCDASRERSKTLDEPFSVNRFLVSADDEIEWAVTKPVRKAMFKGEPKGLELLAEVRPVLAAISTFDATSIEVAISAFVEEHVEGNLGRIAQPLRVAVSGGPISPPIYDTLAILGQEAVLSRVDRCLAAMSEIAAAD
jgi:glutamyl-tRNA synthetase